MTKEQMIFLATSRPTGAQFAALVDSMSGAQLAALVGDIPKVEKLYSTIWTDLKTGQRVFNQGNFGDTADPGEHLCRTAICVAGHTVQLAGAYNLVKKIGFPATATLIHLKSCPDFPVPRYDSCPDEWMLALIEYYAQLEGEIKSA